MTELDLTDEERALVARWALIKADNGSRLSFYAAALFPALVFGIYGMLHKDIVALGLAFVGLVGFLVWRVSRELRFAPLHHSLFVKLDTFLRHSDA